MIYFILVWIAFAIASYCIGFSAIDRISPASFSRLGDRFIASTWLGLLTIAVLLLATSLILPLSPLVGASVIAISVCLSLLPSRPRREIMNLRAKIPDKILFPAAILGAIAALLTTHQVHWGESAFYHYSSTRWLSEYGTVPGIPLLLANLGIISTWFALIAPFNGSMVNFQAGAIANGFIFWLALAHTLICGSRWLNQKATLSDRFAIGFYVFLWLYTAFSQEMRSILVSLSPDLPIMLLAAIVGWAILVITESRTDLPSTSQPALITLILAAGAVTIKLSALPLLLVAVAFYLFETRFKIRPVIWGIVSVSLFLSPMVLVGYQTSGCPLYPSSFLCLDLPWSLSLQDINKFADRTQNPAVWFAKDPSTPISPLLVFWEWLNARALNQIMAIMGLISLFLGVYILKSKPLSQQNRGIFWLLGLGILGIAFTSLKSPLIRFALGYLLILPALAIAIYSENKLLWLKKTSKRRATSVVMTSIFLIALSLSLTRYELSDRWLLPPKVKSATLVHRQVNDIKYSAPAKGPCWASPLPCTPKKNPITAKLRRPSLGIKGGFVRA